MPSTFHLSQALRLSTTFSIDATAAIVTLRYGCWRRPGPGLGPGLQVLGPGLQVWTRTGTSSLGPVRHGCSGPRASARRRRSESARAGSEKSLQIIFPMEWRTLLCASVCSGPRAGGGLSRHAGHHCALRFGASLSHYRVERPHRVTVSTAVPRWVTGILVPWPWLWLLGSG
jgi:hypothetical protein